MERLTYRAELGVSIDKNEDCPSCNICWNCNIPPRECKYISDALKKLANYEDLEEQGRLVKLPCKIGDDVWFVPSQKCYKLNILNKHSEANRVYHQKVARITFSRNGWYLECDKDLEYATDNILVDKMYKEIWFLTKSEAEAKLNELRGNND